LSTSILFIETFAKVWIYCKGAKGFFGDCGLRVADLGLLIAGCGLVKRIIGVKDE
jgi:hypothetical protein